MTSTATNAILKPLEERRADAILERLREHRDTLNADVWRAETLQRNIRLARQAHNHCEEANAIAVFVKHCNKLETDELYRELTGREPTDRSKA